MITPKERPICYTAAMILARREGRKTQTRRIIKGQEQYGGMKSFRDGVMTYNQTNPTTGEHVCEHAFVLGCPKGRAGDRLWIQENHRLRVKNEAAREVQVKYTADETTRFVQLTPDEWGKMIVRETKVTEQLGPVCPGRFMYRSLSRGLDEIVSVRVERLQDISEVDAKDEGVIPSPSDHQERAHRLEYASLINSIHGPDTWNSNPWVWVITFKPLS